MKVTHTSEANIHVTWVDVARCFETLLAYGTTYGHIGYSI